MNVLLPIIILLAAAAAVYFFVFKRTPGRYKGIWRALNGLGIPRSVAKFKFEQSTPKGAEIISTVEIPAQALQDIDEGLESMIAYHEANWPVGIGKTGKGKTPGEFSFVFIDPMETNVETEPGSPAIDVLGIQSAGTTIGTFPNSGADKDYIVLPHQADTNWSHREYLKASVFNEGGHDQLFKANYAVFMFFTGEHDIHPFPFETYPKI